ncbi:MAG TPA: flagellar export protein FliJ [Betaproteobacteria bacterium]|nr:flagellar export protein FliJ [Betaproteobacteria bacterium]
MARRFPLQPLVEHTQDQADKAAKRLAMLKVAWQAADDKLQQLFSFREEYRHRFHLAAQQGMAAAVIADYQAFLRKLDGAIAQQQQEIANCTVNWEAGRREWLETQHKLKAYQTLERRHAHGELQRELRLEQREQDEYAGKSHARQDDEENF